MLTNTNAIKDGRYWLIPYHTILIINIAVSLNTYYLWESFLLDMYKPSKHYVDYLQYLMFKSIWRHQQILFVRNDKLGFPSLNILLLATFLKVK